MQEKSCVSHLIGISGGSCAMRGAPDTTVREGLPVLFPVWTCIGIQTCVTIAVLAGPWRELRQRVGKSITCEE